MDPRHWGPHFWVAMHAAALSFPERPTREDKRRAFRFYESVGWMLPCASCASKYRGMFRQYAPGADDLSSRDALFEWTVNIHNVVNMTLGKPSFDIDRARTVYGFSVRE